MRLSEQNAVEDRVDLGGKRLLIFIVAYNAATTIEKVLRRIPASLPAEDVEVLIIDDSSKDKTFQHGLRYQQNHSAFKITILRTPTNQGYGGNQKLGYRYAIDHGFDIVALVHGDGQYAPEKLPELLEPLVRGKADAVFGSRMIDKKAARAGGMPAYKWLGNQVLTRFSKRLAWHRPFRVSLRLSALCHQRAGADSIREKHQRFPFRHRDHHPICHEKTAHRRASNPDILRRRNLSRERDEVRVGCFQSDDQSAAVGHPFVLRSQVRCESRAGGTQRQTWLSFIANFRLGSLRLRPARAATRHRSRECGAGIGAPELRGDRDRFWRE